jgi:hypothetical protein
MILGHQYSDSSAIAAAFLNGLRSKIALQKRTFQLCREADI